MSLPIKVLDLFAGTQSVRKSLDEAYEIDYWEIDEWGTHKGYCKDKSIIAKNDLLVIEYIGIDIYSPEKRNVIFDLTQDNVVEELISQVLGYWKPDFIWASPVCNKYSIALAGKGGNFYFEVNKETQTIKPRENWNIPVFPHMKQYKNTKKAKDDALFALKMFENTKRIINFFNVNFAIENPRTALSRYVLKEYIANYTNYCMYGFDYKKPTSIYSNKKLELLTCNHKGRHKASIAGKTSKGEAKGTGSYAQRSAVPPKLITEILKQLTKEDSNV